MSEPNDGIFDYSGRLAQVRVGVKTPYGTEPCRPVCEMDRGPLGNNYRWLQPELFEELCDADPMLQGTIFQTLRKGQSGGDYKAVAGQLRRVYLTEYTVLIDKQFHLNMDLLVEYFVAKAAEKRRHPKEFQDVDTEPVDNGRSAPPGGTGVVLHVPDKGAKPPAAGPVRATPVVAVKRSHKKRGVQGGGSAAGHNGPAAG